MGSTTLLYSLLEKSFLYQELLPLAAGIPPVTHCLAVQSKH
jgi:hypothetical protein